MNLRLFLSTFALIFLAELGDKTQLAAMARTATAGSSKWVIFAAASLALVTATLLAVLLGSALTRIVPEHVIKLGAGILFVLFGVLIIHSALRPKEAGAATEAGPMAKVVLRLAAEFERAAAEDYESLAARTTDPATRAVLLALAEEERTHMSDISEAGDAHGQTTLAGVSLPKIADKESLSHDVAASSRPIITHALEHEKATEAFYRELANVTPVSGLKQAFLALAEKESEHVARLEALARDQSDAPVS